MLFCVLHVHFVSRRLFILQPSGIAMSTRRNFVRGKLFIMRSV